MAADAVAGGVGGRTDPDGRASTLGRGQLSRVDLLHAAVPFGRVPVDRRGQVTVEGREEPLESGAPHEPLEVRSPRMVVRAVEARAGNDLAKPPEEAFVTRVHADRDRRLATVAPETALTDENPEKDPEVEGVDVHGVASGIAQFVCL